MPPPFVDIHTHHPCASPEVFSIQSLRPGEQPQSTYYSIGLHPWYIEDLTDEHLQQIEEALGENSPGLCALGEVGLDKISSVPMDRQMEYLRKVVALSEQYSKPLILHIVKAWDELIRLKRELHPSMPWIIHGFRGKPTLAKQLIKENLRLSFGYRHNPDSLKFAHDARALLLETDDSYSSITDIYSRASETLGYPPDDLRAVLWKHTLEIFPNLRDL